MIACLVPGRAAVVSLFRLAVGTCCTLPGPGLSGVAVAATLGVDRAQAFVGDHQGDALAILGFAPALGSGCGRLFLQQALSAQAVERPSGSSALDLERCRQRQDRAAVAPGSGGEDDEVGVRELGHGGLLRCSAPRPSRRSHRPQPRRLDRSGRGPEAALASLPPMHASFAGEVQLFRRGHPLQLERWLTQ